MTNKAPLISIITPCYNAATTIGETINSVLAQSYQNWEMLIVDDCSTDESSEIIRRYAAEDGRIKYFKTESKSGSPARPRNIGIDNASGKYIAFLDADDVWLPDKLTRQIDKMDSEGWDICYSYYEKMNYEGKRDNRIVTTRKTSTFSSLLMSNSIPCLTSVVRRDAVGETRFKQIPQEDFCFWLDVLKKGYTAHNLCEVTALYREARNTRSANKLDMFRGYWNVIRRYQHISLLPACYFMTTYSILGILKYLK